MLRDILTELRKNVDAAEAEIMKSDIDLHTCSPAATNGSATGHANHMSLHAQIESLQIALQFEKNTRFQETAALTRMIEEVMIENETLKRHNNEILMSTSWKVTAPLRAAKDTLLRLRNRN